LLILSFCDIFFIEFKPGGLATILFDIQLNFKNRRQSWKKKGGRPMSGVVNPKTEVCVILGSGSDQSVIRNSNFAEIMEAMDIGWTLSYCSAERHHAELINYLDEVWAMGIRIYVGVVGMVPVLPKIMKALLPKSAIVFGVAKLMPELGVTDPAPTIVHSTPACPILVCGLDKIGMTNTALAIAEILSLQDQELAERLTKFLESYKSGPEFNVE